MCSLVLWPMFAGVLEIFKALRILGRGPTRFILTNEGATIWLRSTSSAARASASLGGRRLRLSVILVCALEAAFIVFLTVFLFQHANPHGDGMEMAGVGFRLLCLHSFLRKTGVGLNSRLHSQLSQQSHISLCGSK
jgi:hypothetical protein